MCCWNAAGEAPAMQTVKYVFWQEGDRWFGYLEECPDYWTQGETFDDLVVHLTNLHVDMSSAQILGVRRS
jgi:hypothetical protein